MDYAVSMSVATKLIPAFSVGLTTKYISQRIWTESAGQLALDVGVHYKSPLPGLNLGASISNFGPDMRLSGKNLTNIIDPDIVNRGIEKYTRRVQDRRISTATDLQIRCSLQPFRPRAGSDFGFG